MPLSAHIKILEDVAAAHLGDDEDINRLLKLKLDHSYKVLDNARDIIQGESIRGHEADLCSLQRYTMTLADSRSLPSTRHSMTVNPSTMGVREY